MGKISKEKREEGDANASEPRSCEHAELKAEGKVEETAQKAVWDEWMTQPKEGWLSTPRMQRQTEDAKQRDSHPRRAPRVGHMSQTTAFPARKTLTTHLLSGRLFSARNCLDLGPFRVVLCSEATRTIRTSEPLPTATRSTKGGGTGRRDSGTAETAYVRAATGGHLNARLFLQTIFVCNHKPSSSARLFGTSASFLRPSRSSPRWPFGPVSRPLWDTFTAMEPSSKALEKSDNASIAEQLRKQLQSGTYMSAPPPVEKKETETTPLSMVAAGGRATPGDFKRAVMWGDRQEEEDVTTLYKRSKHGEDAIDIDATLAKNISRRRRFDTRDDLDVDMEYDFNVGTDLFGKKKKKNRNLTLSDLKRRERRRHSIKEQHEQSLEDRCRYCFNGKCMPKHLVVSIATSAYLRLPDKGALHPLHCMIVPLEHLPSTREVEENAWTEIRNYKKALIHMHTSQGRSVIFIEVAVHLRNHKRHAMVECVPVEEDVFANAPIYFKKAIDDATADWSQHHSKRCIETGTKGLRGSIPTHFPYFHVEFNLAHGFVHVIDDEERFDENLGRRVLIGLLKRPAEEMYQRIEQPSKEEHEHFVNAFVKEWHSFDWTVNL